MNKSITLFIAFIFTIIICKAQSGITWNMGMNIAPSTSGNEHPRIAIDGSGNPLVIWHHANRATFSRWNGTAFTTPVMLNPMSMTVAGASWMGPDIAAHGDTVYVVFKQTPEGSDTCHIFCVHSYDGGVTFSAPVQVDNIADSISRFPTVTTDDAGNPVVAFMKFDPSFMDARWVVAKSSDYGNTFSTDVKASGWSAAGATVCDCCPGAVVNSGSNVAMLYRDNNNNIRDTWAGFSNDGGNTFTSGVNVDQNNWMIMMCPSAGPDGIIVGDTLYSVFMNSASGTARTYFSKTSITGQSASVNLLTGSIPGLGQQNYPRIANAGNALAVVWKQNVSGNDQCILRFTDNIASGFPALYDTVDLSNVTNTDVALTNGKIFVVWEDDNSGTIKYRNGTFTPVNTSVNEITQNNVSVYPNPVTDFVSINLERNAETEITVNDVMGKCVFRQHISNSQYLQINTSAWSNGVYCICFVTEKTTATQKIVVQH